MATMCIMENCTNGGEEILYKIVVEEIGSRWNAALNYFEYQPWFFSLIGSLMVGLSGIFPLFIIPVGQNVDIKHGESAGTLNVLLSFAVGGLLGDVFLHLLPEAWANKSLNQWSEEGHASMAVGLWVLGGFLVFVIAEKLFCGLAHDKDDDDEEEEDEEEEEEEEEEEGDEEVKKGGKEEEIDDRDDVVGESLNNNNFQKELENNNCLMPNGNVKNGCVKNSLMMNIGSMEDISIMNGICCGLTNSCGKTDNKRLNDTKNNENSSYGMKIVKRPSDEFVTRRKMVKDKGDRTERQLAKITENKEKAKHITGYLNLLANTIDNFTHGLAVGGAFLVSFRLGAFTTFAILVHEIPHEVGDFAILLRSGFDRWYAAKAQLLTAGGGILGAMAAVLCSGGSVEARTSWILPFTAGGFLHIGMVSILPELLKETNTMESIKQLAALLIGISLMAIMTIVCD